MHNGAPAHLSIAGRNYLHASYPGRWILTRNACCLASTLPELNSLDFFFRDYLKSLVCETPMTTLQDLTLWTLVSAAS
ncbi:hypothetical protein TNCV_2291681 [Trichonephila clavipes]|uniref:Uncharacterized protein n=1 Tax=Trichonephila clavipes TaxID=2585209 RepID=A0A8X6RL97_TRICX|nr:hypothetical protein TNCV_2291681 [Trichonephila clavipes]